MSGDPREKPAPAQTGVRRLTPENTNVFEGTFSLLHCQVAGDTLYRGVFGVLMFPISHPNRFISLRYTDSDDKAREIGVIDNLADFPPETRKLLRNSLDKQYHEQEILHIHDIKCRYGLLFFAVETRRGPTRFMVPWRHDRAEDYGAKGKVILDALDNRYIIHDIAALPPNEQRRFRGFIYW